MSTPLPTLPAGPPAAGCCAPATRRDPQLDAARLAELARALAEPVRIELVDVLRRHGEPLCQCELLPLFDMPQSTLSHHLKKLADAGVLTVERRHKWAYYTIAPEALEELTTWLS
jgi:ArsR family transcriptional regulator